MTTTVTVILILCIASNLICWIQFNLINKQIKNLKLDQLSSQLNQLQEELSIKQVAVKEELLNEINLSKIRIESLEGHSKNNTELFKTVLHGFDFIVQGCKKAIDSKDEGRSYFNQNEESPKAIESETATASK